MNELQGWVFHEHIYESSLFMLNIPLRGYQNCSVRPRVTSPHRFINLSLLIKLVDLIVVRQVFTQDERQNLEIGIFENENIGTKIACFPLSIFSRLYGSRRI